MNDLVASGGNNTNYISSNMFSSQLVWILSVLCGAEVTSGFVYDRTRRAGEDATSARTDCECAPLVMTSDLLPQEKCDDARFHQVIFMPPSSSGMVAKISKSSLSSFSSSFFEQFAIFPLIS